jgi:hypothetical protein
MSNASMSTPTADNMTTEQKCQEILKKIVELCGDTKPQPGVMGSPTAKVSFAPDWGGNSLTVGIAGLGHSHCGDDQGTFEHLIDQLHDLMCKNRGLSFVKEGK